MRLVQELVVERDHDDVEALPAELLGEHFADAARRARDERPFALVLVLKVLRLPDEGEHQEGHQEGQQREASEDG